MTIKNNETEVESYESEYNGQKVTVHKFKAKAKKVYSNARASLISCPNCLSKMITGKDGLQQCSGDRLVAWENQFSIFHTLDADKKLQYLKDISFDSIYMELYDRWAYSKSNPDDPFTCGFTNKIFLPVPNTSVIIPDPTQVLRIERKLGRKLTEEEVFGEKELFSHRGGFFEEYRDGAKSVKIALLRFPEDCY